MHFSQYKLNCICIHLVWGRRDSHFKRARFVRCVGVSDTCRNVDGKIRADKTECRLYIDHCRLSKSIYMKYFKCFPLYKVISPNAFLSFSFFFPLIPLNLNFPFRSYVHHEYKIYVQPTTKKKTKYFRKKKLTENPERIKF